MSPLRAQECKRKKCLIKDKLGAKKENLVALNLSKSGDNPRYSFNLTRAVKVMGVFCVIIFILEIWMANRLSTYGQKITEIKAAEASLELENQVLENTIAEKSSMTALEEKVSPLGFDTSKTFLYIQPALVAAVH